MEPKDKIKVGIMLNSYTVNAWEAAMIQEFLETDCIEVALVIINKNAPNQNLMQQIWTHRASLVFHAHRKMDEWLFSKIRKPNAFAKLSIKDTLLAGVPAIEVMPRCKVFSDFFPDDAVEEIRSYDLDVMVRNGFRILRGKILKASRYGIWSYHHSDNHVIRGCPAGYWELINREPVIGSILQILSESLDGGLVLYRSWSTTHDCSHYIGLNSTYWKTLGQVTRKIRELHTVGPDQFFRNQERINPEFGFYDKQLYVTPTNTQAFFNGLKMAYLTMRWVFKHYACYDQWYLMFQISKRGVGPEPRKYKKIMPPKSHLYGDPIVVKKDDLYYVFIEEMSFENKIGFLSVLTIDKKGNYTKPQKILERPYHLSYPFVFEYEDQYYMIPESSENRTIQLFRCQEFPLKWEFVTNIMEDVEAVDTTLLFKDGLWWLFTTISERAGMSLTDELSLFYTKDLMSGHWTPHPMNPVISDTRRARGAGRIIERNGRFYRPSQDCSYVYGYGINVNRIDVLTETDYQETVIETIGPDWDPSISRTHTLGQVDRLTIIDVCSVRMKGF